MLNWLQRLGATPNADLRNCRPPAAGEGLGLRHRLFGEEARRLESQLAFAVFLELRPRGSPPRGFEQTGLCASNQLCAPFLGSERHRLSAQDR